jgi:hypothetical protein
VGAQQPDDEAEDAGFAVARQVVGQSEVAEARAVGAHGTSDQTVGVDLAGVEGDGARQACGREDAQRQFHPGRRRMEVMAVDQEVRGHRRGDPAHGQVARQALERPGGIRTPASALDGRPAAC